MTPIFRAAVALSAVLSLSACQQKPDEAFGQKVRAYTERAHLRQGAGISETAAGTNPKDRPSQGAALSQALDEGAARRGKSRNIRSLGGLAPFVAAHKADAFAALFFLITATASMLGLSASLRVLVDKITGANAAQASAATVDPWFLLLFATIEFARVNMIRNTLVNAAYTGARRAMVPGSTAPLAVEEARKVLTICGIRNGDITVTPSNLTQTTNEVSVTVSVPMDKNVWISPMFMKTKNYSRTCTLSRERAKH